MAEYTPTTEIVRQLYANSMDPAGFDRWLAEVRREEAEKGWDEGYAGGLRDAGRGEPGSTPNPYRAAARRDNPYRKEQP